VKLTDCSSQYSAQLKNSGSFTPRHLYAFMSYYLGTEVYLLLVLYFFFVRLLCLSSSPLRCTSGKITPVSSAFP